MNNSSCDGYSETGATVLASTCALSFLVCLVAVVLVFVLRLYKLVVYRLALYQVLAALVNSGQYVINIININYSESPEVYANLCSTLAYVSLSSAWAKMLLTLFVSVHLFCFAVLHKNLKRLEPLYILVSLTAPPAIAAVPAITHSYGLSGSWCWIASWHDNCPSRPFTTAIIEQFALWYGPSMLILALASIAMVVMVIVLISRMYRFGSIRHNQNWNALKQLLPLCVYPIIYFSLHVPPFVFRIISASHKPTSGQIVMAVVCFSGWSLLAGVTLIVHISVATLCSRSKKGGAMYKWSRYTPMEQYGSVGNENASAQVSRPSDSNATYYPLPNDSIIEE
eukprot:Em0022g553a